MTNPDARRVAEQIRQQCGIDFGYDHEELVGLVAAALSEARRQAWEEAAELARACNTQETEHLYHQLRQRALPSEQTETSR